jgi:uncharacterized membrane protein HdeD (DUF308 family)
MSASPSEPVLPASSAASALWAVLMIVTGVLALIMPFAAGLGISVLVAWIIAFGGVLHLAYGISRRATHWFWNVLIGVVYVAGAVYLILHPLVALASLTLLLAAILLMEGVLLIVAWSRHRSMRGAAWLLADGILSLILGALVGLTWLGTAGWLIGMLVGINLIVSGVARLLHRSAQGTIIPIP